MHIRTATFPADSEGLQSVIREYVAWLDMDLSYRGFAEEMASFDARFTLPSGLFPDRRLGTDDRRLRRPVAACQRHGRSETALCPAGISRPAPGRKADRGADRTRPPTRRAAAHSRCRAAKPRSPSSCTNASAFRKRRPTTPTRCRAPASLRSHWPKSNEIPARHLRLRRHPGRLAAVLAQRGQQAGRAACFQADRPRRRARLSPLQRPRK